MCALPFLFPKRRAPLEERRQRKAYLLPAMLNKRRRQVGCSNVCKVSKRAIDRLPPDAGSCESCSERRGRSNEVCCRAAAHGGGSRRRRRPPPDARISRSGSGRPRRGVPVSRSLSLLVDTVEADAAISCDDAAATATRPIHTGYFCPGLEVHRVVLMNLLAAASARDSRMH